jgi:hypothetical protein
MAKSLNPEPNWPSVARSAWRAGVIVGYGMALAVLFVRFVAGELPISTELPGAIALTLVAGVSPTLALLAYPRRPGLLVPAGAIAVLSVPVMSLFGFPMLLIGLTWLWVHHQVSGSERSGAATALLVAVALWFAATTVMFIHLDPTCVQKLRDGTFREVDPSSRGFTTGWVWAMDSTSFSASGVVAGEVVFEACTSNTEVLWESGASIALSVGAVLAGFYLTKPAEMSVEHQPETVA